MHSAVAWLDDLLHIMNSMNSMEHREHREHRQESRRILVDIAAREQDREA